MSAAPVLTKVARFSINIGSGPHKGRVFTFDRPSIIVGRDPECDIPLTEDIKVSRQHVEISIQENKLKIVNKSAKNFILINGERVDQFEFEDLATMQLGESVLEVRVDKPKPGGRPNELVAPHLKLASVPAGLAAKTAAKGSMPPPPRRPRLEKSFLDDPRARFYGIILFIGLIGWYLLGTGIKPKEPPVTLRSDHDIMKSIEQSQAAVKQMLAEQEKGGQQGLQYKTAQEHYLRGFRDYRQGQYARAMQSFQAALSFYPNHDLSRKYWTLSKRKFDESVQFQMLQGQRYLGKNNYRLCKSSFGNAMIMLKDPNDKVYVEAKQKYTECDMRLGGL